MIKIEQAISTDSLAIEELDRQSWVQNENALPYHDADLTWRVWIEHAIVFTAKEDSVLVGVSLAFPTIVAGLCLHKIFVHQNWQQQNIASRLVDCILEEADRIEIPIFVNIFTNDKKAIALFEKQGFAQKPDQSDSNRITHTTLFTRQTRSAKDELKTVRAANSYLASIYK